MLRSSALSLQTQIEEILAIEQIDTNLFRATSPKYLNGRVYGGQLVAQAMRAASETVAPERRLHSLHSYFVRPGDIHSCIIYKVESLRDGASFSSRRVNALQHDKLIFYMTASFQAPEEGLGLSHQFEMPPSPAPETLDSHQTRFQKYSQDPSVSERMRSKLEAVSKTHLPMDIRYVYPMDLLHPQVAPPTQLLWVKPSGSLSANPLLHQCVVAYSSDWALINVMLRPFGRTFQGLSVASLDHSIWFHQEFRADDWMMYELTSPRTSNSRGLAFGRVFNAKGELVASFAQEGLIRPVAKM